MYLHVHLYMYMYIQHVLHVFLPSLYNYPALGAGGGGDSGQVHNALQIPAGQGAVYTQLPLLFISHCKHSLLFIVLFPRLSFLACTCTYVFI